MGGEGRRAEERRQRKEDLIASPAPHIQKEKGGRGKRREEEGGTDTLT